MKRSLFKLALFLLLGSVVNVGVAWGIITRGKIDTMQPWVWRLATESDLAWLVDLGWQPSQDTKHLSFREEIREKRHFALTIHKFVESSRPKGLSGSTPYWPWVIAASIRSGWPMQSMEGALVHEAAWKMQANAGRMRQGGGGSSKTGLPLQSGLPPYDRERTINAVRLPKSNTPGGADDGYLLPLKPIWPSFALNTLFYAVVLWIPFAPFVLRKAIRRKRGLCIKCGYDLRNVEHEKCPECGYELTASAKL